MTDAQEPTHGRVPSGSRDTLLLAALATLCLSYSALQSAVVPALPVFQRAFGTTPAWAAWVVTGFTLVSIVATLMMGVFAVRVGYRRILLGTVVVFAAATFMAALAPTIGVLIILRAVQGVGGALFPLAYAIASHTLPPRRVGSAIGIISAMFGVGAALGFPLAGLVIDTIGWQFIFVGAGVVIVLGGLACALTIPETPQGEKFPLDVPGIVGIMVWPSLLFLSVTLPAEWGWTSPGALTLYLAAGAVLTWWWRMEQRASFPLVDLEVLRRRAVAVPNFASFATGFALFGALVLSLQYAATPFDLAADVAAQVDYGLGASPTVTGFLLTPAALAMMVTAPATGRAGTRFAFRDLLVAGLIITALGCISLAVINDTLAQIGLGMLIMGTGAGIGFAAMPVLMVEAVHKDDTAAALATNMALRQFGVVAGAQLGAVVLTVHTIGRTGVPRESAYVTVFLTAAVLAIIAAAVTRTQMARR